MARYLAPGHVPSGREPVEGRVDETRQRLEVVAALEDGRDPVRQSPATPCELTEPLLAHAHVPERVRGVGVEAGRDEHELWLESLDGRLDDAREDVEILGVPAARLQRHVEGRLGLVVGAAATWIEGPLVERDEEDAVVVAKDRVRPVAVMDVEVDDRHALETQVTLCRAG